MKSRRRIVCADCGLDTLDYSRDLRPAKWASGVILHGSNREPPMSALGQKRTLLRVIGMSALCQKQTFCAAVETDAIRLSGRLFIPPALRERNVRLREFVSYGEDSMFHCGAIALEQRRQFRSGLGLYNG